jgi:O-antigen biosynthesis protein
MQTDNGRFRGQIVVLGMHRSGTSCVGNLLTKSGAYFGDESVSIGASEENRKGFFERRDVRDICDAILHGTGCDWWAVADFSHQRVPMPVRAEAHSRFAKLLEEMNAHRPWFIKEPRLCLIWPLLQPQSTDPVYIHVWRHPIEVAKSLATRNGFSIDFGVALWELYVRAGFAVSRDQPSAVLSYNALLKDPKRVFQRLIDELAAVGATGLVVPSDEQLRDAVDMELYRQRHASSELEDMLLPSQRRLLNALQAGDLTNPALTEPIHPASTLRIADWMRREAAIIEQRITLRAKIGELNNNSKLHRAEKMKSELRERALVSRHKQELGALTTRESQLVSRHKQELEALTTRESQLVSHHKRELKDLTKQHEHKLKAVTARRELEISKLAERLQQLRRRIERDVSEAAEKVEILTATQANSLRIMHQSTRAFGAPALLRGLRRDAPILEDDSIRCRALHLHYALICRRKDASDLVAIAVSGLFDPVYYLSNYPDVAKDGGDALLHYMDHGAAENRNPSEFFDTEYYLAANPQVEAERVNPLLHYVLHGMREGRLPRRPRTRKIPLPELDTAWAARGPRPIPDLGTKRVVVFTAIAGGYDKLAPPAVRPPNCDFVVFSDQPMEIEGWQVQPFNYLNRDSTRTARFVKTHPHVYFPEYDYAIWIDANIGILGDIREFIAPLTADNAFIGIFEHPLRDCIYAEARECIKRRKDEESIITRHVDRYRSENFPEHAGLWETNVVVVRPNHPGCVALMSAWWSEIESGSRRDQLSLPVVARRMSATIHSLDDPGICARNHESFDLAKHSPTHSDSQPGVVPAAARKPVDLNAISMSIGVCVYNSPEETRACLESLLATRRAVDRIVVVDDASDTPTAAMLDQIAAAHRDVTLIRHEQTRGYTQSANHVLRECPTDWVVLLNSDTVVPPTALMKLVACGEQFSRIGIVGPLSNAASWQSVPKLTGPDGKFMVNRLPASLTVQRMDELCEELATGPVPFVPIVNGFCMAIRQSVIREIGLFDVDSFPVGYGEEDDFCLRAGAAGYVCGIATDAYVYHVKSASFTSERRTQLAAEGGVTLRKKHSAERVAAALDVLRYHSGLSLMRDNLALHLG